MPGQVLSMTEATQNMKCQHTMASLVSAAGCRDTTLVNTTYCTTNTALTHNLSKFHLR